MNSKRTQNERKTEATNNVTIKMIKINNVTVQAADYRGCESSVKAGSVTTDQEYGPGRGEGTNFYFTLLYLFTLKLSFTTACFTKSRFKFN